jgi:hypothetical protein
MARPELSSLPQQDLHQEVEEDYDLSSDEDEELAEADPNMVKQLEQLEKAAEAKGQVIELPRSVKILKEVPEHLKFQEDHPAYTQIPEIIHKRYSGKENAIHSNQTRKGGKMPASIFLRRFLADGRHEDVQFVNDIGHDAKEEKFLRATKWEDTQYPSVSIFIQRDAPLSNIEARIFGSNLIQDKDRQPPAPGQQLPPVFEYNVGPQVNREYTMAGTPMADLAQKGSLVQTVLRLRRDGKAIAWKGITDADIREIIKKRADPKVQLQPWEDAVWHIHLSHEVTINNFPKAGKKAQQEDVAAFQTYFTALMDTARRFGDFWFYSLTRPDLKLSEREDTFEDLGEQPPRWLVERWWPVKDTEGNIIQVIALKWGEMNVPTVWPSPETANIAWRLNIGRCRDTKSLTMSEALKKQSGNIIADFLEHEPGYFKVDVWANLTGNTINVDDMRPEHMTGCTLKVLQSDGSFSRDQYRGIVVPNFWKTQATFTVYVKGKINSALHGNRHYITMELETSPIALDRQDISMQLLMSYMSVPDRSGPDVGRFALGCAPQSGVQNPWLQCLSDGQKQTMLDICKSKNLNEEQMAFIKDFLSCKTGVTTLVGPPGTGKSQALVALIIAYHRSNNIWRPTATDQKILVVCPSNRAIDQLTRRLIDADSEVASSCLRFVSGPLSEDKKSSDDMDVDNADQDSPQALNNANYRLAEQYMAGRKLDDKLAAYHFDTKFKDFVKELHKSTSNNDIKNVASNWFRAMRTLKDSNFEVRKKARASKKECENTLLPLFWDTIKIIFTTLNSAAHDTLRNCFRASLIIIDEAGMAQIPDMMTAIAPNMLTVQHMILAGDPDQQRPMRLAKNRNEFGKLQEISLLEQITSGRLKDDGLTHTMLRTQYRTIPEIADMFSNLTYKGQIVNAESVKTPKDLVYTARSFFRGLGDQYFDWDCFGVAVSDSHVYSEKYLSTTSQANTFEADLIVRTVQGLIAQEPAPGKPKIELKDILILSPYQGQINHLKIELSKRRLMVDPNNCPMVESVGTVQGSEANIVLVSLCVNRPETQTKCKFISDHRLLNVAISRAKCMMVMFGNFLPWIEALRSDEKHFEKQGMNALGNLVDYIHPRRPGLRPNKMISFKDYTALVNKEAVKTEAQFQNLLKLAGNLTLNGKRPMDDVFGQGMSNKKQYNKDQAKVLAANLPKKKFVKTGVLAESDIPKYDEARSEMMKRVAGYKPFTIALFQQEIVGMSDWLPTIASKLKQDLAAEFEKQNPRQNPRELPPRPPVIDPALIPVGRRNDDDLTAMSDLEAIQDQADASMTGT